MREKDVETDKVSTAAPEDTVPAVECEQQPDVCADLAQVIESLGMQTPPLTGPETSALTGSPTTDSGYPEAVSRLETEEGEDQRVMRAASLCVLSPSSDFQSVGSTPSPERTIEADTQPEFGGEDMIGTSSPIEVCDPCCCSTSCAGGRGESSNTDQSFVPRRRTMVAS